MIRWFCGNTGSGKTNAAHACARVGDVVLDGDELREVWPGLDLSEESRREQNYRVARLALLLSRQGVRVWVAVICPYADQRRDIIEMIGYDPFIYLWSESSPNKPWDKPEGRGK